ncbi:response regulator [Roseomonas sp. WA12]
MVLDDDELVLDVTVQALEDAGYIVQMAETTAAALHYLEGSGPCQVLLTDINLGEPLNGFAVVERARVARPDIKVIYYSGLPGNWHGRPLGEQERRLAKPFSFEDLLEVMRELKAWPSNPPELGARSSF